MLWTTGISSWGGWGCAGGMGVCANWLHYHKGYASGSHFTYQWIIMVSSCSPLAFIDLIYGHIRSLHVHAYNSNIAELYPPKWFTDDLASGTPSPIGVAKILLCRTNSNPISKYRWLKDGSYITNKNGNYSYRINNIGHSDVGRYRCEASNIIGGILSAPGDVKVACKLLVLYHNALVCIKWKFRI